eukprot:CAMPEP_0184429556 /NCGR_PEP_ID=MMETSP0738-20130409/242546_1 /TAXON_ID=385413 /ORGANISM="Thalassiosira miniscula, Strain CCMP1093" /LENGTH=31 /DNA_ID= /DNA_START= /DNA_END= /DNA_ORIENTATION=
MTDYDVFRSDERRECTDEGRMLSEPQQRRSE